MDEEGHGKAGGEGSKVDARDVTLMIFERRRDRKGRNEGSDERAGTRNIAVTRRTYTQTGCYQKLNQKGPRELPVTSCTTGATCQNLARHQAPPVPHVTVWRDIMHHRCHMSRGWFFRLKIMCRFTSRRRSCTHPIRGGGVVVARVFALQIWAKMCWRHSDRSSLSLVRYTYLAALPRRSSR